MWGMLQDTILELTEFLGGGADTMQWLMGLPLPSLTSGYKSLLRIRSRRDRERLLQTYVGAQCTKESVDKMISIMDRGSDNKPVKTDVNRFLATYGTGKGFRKKTRAKG